MPKLILVRGLPGSGKSTFARRCFKSATLVEADQFFVRNGFYRFDPALLVEAHADCLRRTREALHLGDTVVANTFVLQQHVYPYVQLQRELPNVELFVVSLFDSGFDDATLALRNVHGVPLETISRMRATWES